MFKLGPESYGHGVVSVVRPSVRLFVLACVRKLCPKKNFSSETIDWIFTKFHRNVPKVVLFEISSNNCVQ